MFLDIQKIPAEGLRFDEALKLPPLTGPAGETLHARGVRLRGSATPGGHGVDLHARLETELTLTCGRCLDPVPFTVSTDVELVLVPGDPEEDSPGTGREIEVQDADASLFACPEGKADLAALATEQIYLALPLKPLCREGCLGLCPQCGQNRNNVGCTCAREETDPRLAPLLEFKKDRSGS